MDTNTNPWSLPAIGSHLVNTVLLLVSIIIVLFNWTTIRQLSADKLATLVLTFSIAIGVHGLSHLGLRTLYNIF